jgi:hypothetical protein
MKTITRKENNVSAYIFDDSVELTMSTSHIKTPDFTIGDRGSNNAIIHENVIPPEDWQGNRYSYDGTTWTEVDGWVDPRLAEIAHLEAQIEALRGIVASESVTVSVINETPTITLTDGTPAFTEKAGVDDWTNAVVINNSIAITDLDGTAPQSATVTITNAKAGDALGFTAVNGVTGALTVNNTVLTLTATGNATSSVSTLTVSDTTLAAATKSVTKFTITETAVLANTEMQVLILRSDTAVTLTGDGTKTLATLIGEATAPTGYTIGVAGQVVTLTSTATGATNAPGFPTGGISIAASSNATGNATIGTLTNVAGLDAQAQVLTIANGVTVTATEDGTKKLVDLLNEATDPTGYTITKDNNGQLVITSTATGVLNLDANSLAAALSSVKFNNSSDTPDESFR